MDVAATTKYARVSSTKVRDLARRMAGLPVSEALQIAEFNERKGARLLGKTLKSAIANAENNAKLSVNDLRVKVAVVEEGPGMRRYWARARGMVSPVRKRTCHVRIVLTDGKEEQAAEA
jgi:large subunit ribosomal protein L22